MKNVRIALSVAAVLCATSAFAGASYDAAGCVKNADGSGYCYGTYRAFRNHWNPQTSVSFRTASDSLPAFYVTYQATTTSPVIDVYCFARNSLVQAMWPQLISNEQYFSVVWNAAGDCTHASITRGSEFVVP